jgi:hypothetical protein
MCRESGKPPEAPQFRLGNSRRNGDFAPSPPESRGTFDGRAKP